MHFFLRILATLAFLALYHPTQVFSQALDERLFSPSRMISVEISKKQLKKIYLQGNHPKTLHCGCYFDKIQQVYPRICDHGPKGTGKRDLRKVLDWVHAVPISIFAKPLKCWDEALCRRDGNERSRGSRCCNVLSPKFKTREADMHNLFPAVVAEGETAGNAFGGMHEYKYCRGENKSLLSFRSGVRGDLARAYLYMSHQYRVTIPAELEDRLRKWHLEDPPDAWEVVRNSLIEGEQGNRNPFIDHPEIVERVRDF